MSSEYPFANSRIFRNTPRRHRRMKGNQRNYYNAKRLVQLGLGLFASKKILLNHMEVAPPLSFRKLL
jgi:hypothetical protein